jgi:uncharacterized hydrophobic protein (TIGR00271 family)
VIHLRIVVPEERGDQALDLLDASSSVVNIVHLPGAARKPAGDVILCDVAREDGSVILAELRELGIHRDGSIAVEEIDTAMSDVARQAEQAAVGLPSDAVVWEEVEERTSESAELSVSFLAFMVISMLIAAVGVALGQPVLVIGAMVVGPEFGPIAGFCVALVARRGELARRSIIALAVGFPLGIVVTYLASLLARSTGIGPETLADPARQLTAFVSDPSATSVIVAYLAGTAGILSLTSTKSGALVGVLISVTTIPAAGNVGLASAYGDWAEAGGAGLQLVINLLTIFVAGIVTLYVQRLFYVVRRRRRKARAGDAPARPLSGAGTATGGPAAPGEPGGLRDARETGPAESRRERPAPGEHEKRRERPASG